MLYFDHCASTPPHPDVIRTMAEVMQLHYANPSSLHRAGREAGALVERARRQLADLFGVGPKEWVFTSGGTESNQLAVKGAALRFRGRGNHLITTEVEHPSVYEAFRQLERSGFRVTYLQVDRFGTISIDRLKQALTEDTVLVSIMHVNNEVGTIQPVAEVGELLRAFPKTLFHVDGVQSIGKLPVRLKEWGVDLFSGSAHKLRGPKGSGFLYVREGLDLEPLFSGGSQERGLRGGTPNVAGIVAAAKAVRLAVEGQPQRLTAMGGLQARLTARLAAIPELVLNSGGPAAAPHIVHFSYPGMKPEVIVHQLEELGMLVSTKSACSSKDDKPSRVLLAMGCSRERAASGIRVSFGDEHTTADIDALADAVREAVKRLKPMERSGATTS